MSYFETTPMGRVLNRFSYDMEVVDMTLTEVGWERNSLIGQNFVY